MTAELLRIRGRVAATALVVAVALVVAGCGDATDYKANPDRSVTSVNAAALQEWLDGYEPDLANWTDAGDVALDGWPENGPRACGDVELYFINDMAPEIPPVPDPDLESDLRTAMRAVEHDAGVCASADATRMDAVQLRVDGAKVRRVVDAIRTAAGEG